MTQLSTTARELIVKEMNRIEKDVQDARVRRASLKQQIDACEAGIETLEQKYETLRKDLI